jgi:3-hydroxybutyryl-CoA dehydrogenase
MESDVKKIAVLGAGLMGHGIAQMAAQVGGYEVSLLDMNQEFVDRGMRMVSGSLAKFLERGRITGEQADAVLRKMHPTTDLSEALSGCQLVIEAVNEDAKLKMDLLKRVSDIVGDGPVIASNTSSISMTLLGSATRFPEKMCGMHFFNPAQLMSLVEIIRGRRTSDATYDLVRRVAVSMGKETVSCKDSPGFLVNRILAPALNEAVFLVSEGVASPEDIDKAIRLGLNWPMGPLELIDYVGLDTTLNIMQVFMDEFQDPKYRASPLMRELVRARKLGRKSGEGFYQWDSRGPVKRKET